MMSVSSAPMVVLVTTIQPSKWLGLWTTPERETVRVVLVITVSGSSLLILWAFFFIVCGSRAREHRVIFVLNLLYISCLQVTLIFLIASLYVTPSDPICPLVKCLSHLAVMLTISLNVLVSLHTYLTSQHTLLMSRMAEMPRQLIAFVGIYFFIAMAIPVFNTYFFISMEQQTFASRRRTVCWITPDNILWLVVPLVMYVTGSVLIAAFTRVNYDIIPPTVRCSIYTCTVILGLFCGLTISIQLDIVFRTVSSAFLLLGILLAHNICVWLHLSDNIVELCPCSTVPSTIPASELTLGEVLSQVSFPRSQYPTAHTQPTARTPTRSPAHREARVSPHGWAATPGTPLTDRPDRPVPGTTPTVYSPPRPATPGGQFRGPPAVARLAVPSHHHHAGVAMTESLSNQPVKSVSVDDAQGAMETAGESMAWSVWDSRSGRFVSGTSSRLLAAPLMRVSSADEVPPRRHVLDGGTACGQLLEEVDGLSSAQAD